ncbi:MAG TPA: transcriptional regulator [Croceibacterium sp.]|nr:transcriptional regulator [Croceibacterium sp.]
MSTFQSTLAAYLGQADNAEQVLAERINRSQAAVNRYRNGKRFPDAETARLIHEATGGQVPFSAWEADFLVRSGLAPAQQDAAA